MIIVLEGPDGSGKSTLAEKIYRATGATGVRHGPPPRGKAFHTFMATAVFAAHCPAPVVIDRLHWGAYPYGEVHRGGSELSFDEISEIDEHIIAAGGIICYVRADADVVNQRIIDRGEELSEFEDPEKMRQVVALYDDLYEEMLVRHPEGVILLDHNQFGNVDAEAAALIDYANARSVNYELGRRLGKAMLGGE